MDIQAFNNSKVRTILFSWLLFQSAVQPLWVLAYSTVIEYSLQEDFYRVPLPAARQTHNLEDQWLERSNSCHRRALVAEGGTMGKKWPRILPKVATSSLLGSFTCRKVTTRDRRLYFPSEGRRAEDFFAWKIRWLRPGLNLWTRVPKASTLPLDHRSRYFGPDTIYN
jgi:hypothetical protein